jgi:hypothetical protein
MTSALKYIGLLLIAALLVARPPHQSAEGNPPKAQDPDQRVADFKLSDQTLFDGLAILSSKRIPLALGFEEMLKAKFNNPPPQDLRFSLDLKDKTAAEIVATLCTMDSRYTWSRDDLTINVYPWVVIGDPAYLLNRKLAKLAVTKLPDPDHALLAIIQQLPPPLEQISYVGMGGDSSYVAPWDMTFQDLTVRQAINRLAAHMGSRSQWLFYGSRDFRSFAFFKDGFNPRADDSNARQ